jgi:polar amino acid transport system substrate-binding protein
MVRKRTSGLQAKVGIAAPLLFTLSLTAACGGSSSPANNGSNAVASQSASGQTSALNAMLPDRIKKSGVINTSFVSVGYPPFEFLGPDNKTFVGLDADLDKALGDALGVKINFINVSFAQEVIGLKEQKYDMSAGALSDTTDTEKSIDLVDYLRVGTTLLVKAGNPTGATGIDSFCGKGVLGASAGSGQEDYVKQVSAKCVADGKGSIKTATYNAQPLELLALQAGRIQGDAVSTGQASYLVRTHPGKYQLLGQPSFSRLYGVGVNKSDPQLRDALKAALQSLIDNGTYLKILKKWQLDDSAVSEATVNTTTPS